MANLLTILLFSLLELMAGEKVINLTFVGDAMQHGPQIEAAQQPDGSFDYTPCFQHIAADIADADFAVANLECPLAGKPYQGYPNFSAPDEFAEHLRNSGFDFIITANNHCLDRRDAGLRHTVKQLDKLQMPHAGTYVNAQERAKQCPHIVDVDGMKLAIMSYTYGTNGIKIQKDVVVDYIDREKISADIAKAKQLKADMICVCVHWGVEYKLIPEKSQYELADFLADQGVDIIIGSHPHVVQPMEIRINQKTGKRVLIAYSLGNFISNQNGTNSRGGAMVKVQVRFDIYGNASLKNAAYKLFFCQKPKEESDNYILIPRDCEHLVRNDSKAAFNQFMNNALNLFNQHNKWVEEDTGNNKETKTP